MITIMGATGHTGKRITELLLESGENVRGLGRSTGKLAALGSAGAEVLAGNAEDSSFLSRAFRGAKAVYALIPPDIHSADYRAQQDREGDAIVTAVRDAGVSYVVFLSSIGGDVASGTGTIAGLHAQEQRLRDLRDVNVLILRAAYFFENFFATLGLIKDQGINGGAIGPDVEMPMISTRDIAAVAAQALAARDWNGIVVRELLGQRELTHAEATHVIGARIGKPDLRYVQFPYGGYVAALVQMGVSRNVAELYAEMARATNEGIVRSLEGRRPENTTPTRFEDFAETLAQALLHA